MSLPDSVMESGVEGSSVGPRRWLGTVLLLMPTPWPVHVLYVLYCIAHTVKRPASVVQLTGRTVQLIASIASDTTGEGCSIAVTYTPLRRSTGHDIRPSFALTSSDIRAVSIRWKVHLHAPLSPHAGLGLIEAPAIETRPDASRNRGASRHMRRPRCAKTFGNPEPHFRGSRCHTKP